MNNFIRMFGLFCDELCNMVELLCKTMQNLPVCQRKNYLFLGAGYIASDGVGWPC
jgi:hypothetical protein